MKSVIDHLEAELRSRQSAARFRHSLAVAGFAATLGERHGWDPVRATIAGLAHDWAKEWSPRRLLGYVRRYRLAVPNLDFILEHSPNLMHAYVSADVARRKGWLTDRRDIAAVRSHTLGAVRMDTPAQVLYVADLASPDRRFAEAESIRIEALDDLKRGFASALRLKLTYQLRKGKPVHPLPIRVWNRVVCGGAR